LEVLGCPLPYEGELLQIRSQPKKYMAKSQNKHPPLVGTPEQVAEQVKRYINAGVSLIIIRFKGKNIKKEAELFINEVVPQLG
jgi:alkanesulfonate monooxygenase SsuD/methylene tetrahydromethanopterin reductase-like flavin-dependent oxidoreductase (luciferase family)